MYVWKWHVDSRARLVLVPLLGLHLRRLPNFNLSLLLSLGTVCKAAMATSMEVDGTALGQPATLHSVPQVHEQPIMHTGRPLSNGSYPSLYPLSLVTVVLLVWTHAMAQAPRIANPSEKSLSKYTFGGLREILGCMWGVRQFRWTQRDIPLKSVSYRIHTPSPLWTDLLKL
jgi:hypothetical protein